MLLRIVVFVLIVAAALVGGSFLLPGAVQVERSIHIARGPMLVYLLLNDFHHFQQWSPWAERDPHARIGFEGPDTGVGTRLRWDGDPRQVGKGWQEIVESEPPSLVRARLHFEGQGEAEARFSIRPVDDGSRVSWTFETDVTKGRNFLGGLIGKYMGLFLDRWVGKDYEEGLARLKDYAETFPDAELSDFEADIVAVEPVEILFVSSSSGQSDDAIALALAAAYGEIGRFMAERGIEYNGMPMSIVHSWSEDRYAFDAAIPVKDAEVEPGGLVQSGQSPSGRAVRAVHRGPYSELPRTYEKLAAYMAAHRLEQGEVSWEEYVSDPGDTPEDALITHVYFKLAE